jgi:hypothetical protein
MTSCACGLIDAVTSVRADAWAAIAQWVTVVIAGGAAWFAYRQVGEARKTREAVAQPNVVVFSDLNPVNPRYIDLVIKNFGEKPAYNITLDIEPLERALDADGIDGFTSVALPSEIAVLAPGQEWRTYWDSIASRKEIERMADILDAAGVPRLKTLSRGMVYFTDRDKTEFDNPVHLDANMFSSAFWIMET